MCLCVFVYARVDLTKSKLVSKVNMQRRKKCEKERDRDNGTDNRVKDLFYRRQVNKCNIDIDTIIVLFIDYVAMNMCR